MKPREDLQLRLSPTGRFQCCPAGGDEFQDAWVRPCFPLSNPTKWYSLHDEDGHEIGLVEELGELDAASRGALESALATSGFLLQITGIASIDTEHDIRNWKVETAGGARRFQTRLGSWPRKLADGGVLITDVAEDLYLIPDIAALDARSRKILWAFSD